MRSAPVGLRVACAESTRYLDASYAACLHDFSRLKPAAETTLLPLGDLAWSWNATPRMSAQTVALMVQAIAGKPVGGSPARSGSSFFGTSTRMSEARPTSSKNRHTPDAQEETSLMMVPSPLPLPVLGWSTPCETCRRAAARNDQLRGGSGS